MIINCKTMRPVSMGDTDVTSKYLKEVRQLNTLTSEEQLELIRKYSISSDIKEKNEIRNKLMLANQLFIISMARHLATDNDFNDLINEGNIGMAKAIDMFDVKMDNKFLTYAIHHIRKAMVDYQYNTERLVKPKNTAWVSAYSDSTKNKFFTEYGRYPSYEELKDILQKKGIKIVNEEDLYDIKCHSIDENYTPYAGRTDEDNDRWFDNVIYEKEKNNINSNTDSVIENLSVHQMVQLSLSCLSNDEKDLICKYYGIGCEQMTPTEIAMKKGYGLKPEKIEKLIDKYIKKIRKHGKVQTNVH